MNLIERLRATNKRVRHSQELRDEAADALEQVQKYAPYPGDQALAGESMPPIKSILDLIRYCTTIHSRFGNTCVDDLSLKWGGSALNYKGELQERIEQLESESSEIIAAGEPWCYEGGGQATNGECPAHHGDACLRTPEGLVKMIMTLLSEVSRLRKYARHADTCPSMLHGGKCICGFDLVSEGLATCDHTNKGGVWFDGNDEPHCMNCAEIVPK